MSDLAIYLQKARIAFQIQSLISQLTGLEERHSCPDFETLKMLREQQDFWNDWERAVRALCDRNSKDQI